MNAITYSVTTCHKGRHYSFRFCTSCVTPDRFLKSLIKFLSFQFDFDGLIVHVFFAYPERLSSKTCQLVSSLLPLDQSIHITKTCYHFCSCTFYSVGFLDDSDCSWKDRCFKIRL